MRSQILPMAALACALLFAGGASAQTAEQVDPSLLLGVFPAADRFGPREGAPPVWRAYADDELLGYVFLTSDVPPEEKGYSGPIEVLVGMDLAGTLTGARVMDYHESLRSSRGDFLKARGFQEQFAGKHLSDAFRLRRDILGLSGATITVTGMARGIRSAARRVAAAYMSEARGPVTAAEIERLTWPELVMRGVADRLTGVEKGVLRIDLFLVPLKSEEMGRTLMGDAYDEAIQKAGDRLADHDPWMVGIDGASIFFYPSQLRILRAADTVSFSNANLILTGEPRSGKVEGQLRNVGLLLVDASVDPSDDFTWEVEFGSTVGWARADHGEPRRIASAPTGPPRPVGEGDAAVEAPSAAGSATPASAGTNVVAAPPTGEEAGATDGVAPAAPTAPAGVASTADATPDTEGASETEGAAEATTGAAAVGASAAVSAPLPTMDFSQFDFADEAEETLLQRTLEQTSWVRFGVMLGVLALATAAFFAKIPALRWVGLAVTLIVLGWGGGGFLSVSHITAGIKVGPSVYLENLPLLLLVAFTVVTTLLWGRVFCGYLCPFGALQDFMEHVIPQRWRRKLPHPVHESGVFLKYGVLAIIVVPALMGSDASIFQYFEPFGTVFFLSRSTLLWAIAAAILVASAIIPRFYCRYMCPLGASLALGSLLAPFRIKRVEHCQLCTVCEHACPTGAILRESIDFRECVRCNACEVKLTERAGVCRHDLEKVSHLIQIGMAHPQKGHPLEVVGGD